MKHKISFSHYGIIQRQRGQMVACDIPYSGLFSGVQYFVKSLSGH